MSEKRQRYIPEGEQYKPAFRELVEGRRKGFRNVHFFGEKEVRALAEARTPAEKAEAEREVAAKRDHWVNLFTDLSTYESALQFFATVLDRVERAGYHVPRNLPTLEYEGDVVAFALSCMRRALPDDAAFARHINLVLVDQSLTTLGYNTPTKKREAVQTLTAEEKEYVGEYIQAEGEKWRQLLQQTRAVQPPYSWEQLLQLYVKECTQRNKRVVGMVEVLRPKFLLKIAAFAQTQSVPFDAAQVQQRIDQYLFGYYDPVNTFSEYGDFIPDPIMPVASTNTDRQIIFIHENPLLRDYGFLAGILEHELLHAGSGVWYSTLPGRTNRSPKVGINIRANEESRILSESFNEHLRRAINHGAVERVYIPETEYLYQMFDRGLTFPTIWNAYWAGADAAGMEAWEKLQQELNASLPTSERQALMRSVISEYEKHQGHDHSS